MTFLARCLTGVLLLSATVLAPGAVASAADNATRDYLQALERICNTGVTQEMQSLYRNAVAALDREGQVVAKTNYQPAGRPAPSSVRLRTTTNPHGRATDFWEPRPPDLAYLNNCVHQAR